MEEGAIYLMVKRDGVKLDASLLPTYLSGRGTMKFRLHPVLLPFFLFLIVTGSISMYALIFISLLIHEAGHLLAAYLTGMRVRSCTIMPYGGELVISNRHMAPEKEIVSSLHLAVH